MTAPSRYLSPLRYPGAKSSLVPVIEEIVLSARAALGPVQLLVEPFAGGASTSLRLAASGVVERVLLSDADPLVAKFWQVAAAETDWLIDRMYEEPVTLDRWDYWRSWLPNGFNDRELAVKCLFLNRTTFSGILHGRAGPIGGRAQSSQYTIDCRFNKDALAERLKFIGALYRANRIVDVWCKDWQAALSDVAEWYPELLPNRVLAYLDPPYVAKSEKLYGKSFDPSGGYSTARSGSLITEWDRGLEHYRLAEYLRRRAQHRWLLSYDSHSSLLTDPGLYAAGRMTPGSNERQLLGVKSWYISKRIVDLSYSVSGHGRNDRAEELLLTTLPAACVPAGSRLRPA
jgi:DNA adenine methylase